MTQDRTGQVWEYSAAGKFLVVGSPTTRQDGHDSAVEWMDHPIVWLDDKFASIRAGRRDGFIEYPQTPWEYKENFKRIA